MKWGVHHEGLVQLELITGWGGYLLELERSIWIFGLLSIPGSHADSDACDDQETPGLPCGRGPRNLGRAGDLWCAANVRLV